jgi:hypothetical protein
MVGASGSKSYGAHQHDPADDTLTTADTPHLLAALASLRSLAVGVYRVSGTPGAASVLKPAAGPSLGASDFASSPVGRSAGPPDRKPADGLVNADGGSGLVDAGWWLPGVRLGERETAHVRWRGAR